MADLYPGFDIPAARENWRKRIDERTRQRRKLWEKARTEADRAVEGVTDPETWSRLETDVLEELVSYWMQGGGTQVFWSEWLQTFVTFDPAS